MHVTVNNNYQQISTAVLQSSSGQNIILGTGWSIRIIIRHVDQPTKNLSTKKYRYYFMHKKYIVVDSPQVTFEVHRFVVDDINDSLVLPLQTNGDVDSCRIVMQLSTACSIHTWP